MDALTYENIEQFLNPIPGKDPQGRDIKYENVYDQIKEASREDLDLPQGVWVRDLKSANWKETEKLCIEVLINQSKDLQVAAWMLEAWVSLYHMKGAKAGFNLLDQLSEKFWDTAFPALNPEDPEFRAAPYNWINEKLADRFNKIEVTYPDDQDLRAYSYAAYIDVHKDGGVRVTKQEEEKDKERDPERFKKSIEKTKDDFFKALKKDGDETLTFIKKLQTFLDSKFPENGPSLYHAQEKIQEIIGFAEQVLAERSGTSDEAEVNVVGDAGTEETEKKEGSTETPAPKNNSAEVHVDTVMNSRTEAYAVIEKAANYLEKLDPHSPSPHLIKRAIKWGNLDLKQLLNEMVKDPSSLGELRHLLGISPESEATPDSPTEDQDQNPNNIGDTPPTDPPSAPENPEQNS